MTRHLFVAIVGVAAYAGTSAAGHPGGVHYTVRAHGFAPAVPAAPVFAPQPALVPQGVFAPNPAFVPGAAFAPLALTTNAAFTPLAAFAPQTVVSPNAFVTPFAAQSLFTTSPLVLQTNPAGSTADTVATLDALRAALVRSRTPAAAEGGIDLGAAVTDLSAAIKSLDDTLRRLPPPPPVDPNASPFVPKKAPPPTEKKSWAPPRANPGVASGDVLAEARRLAEAAGRGADTRSAAR